MNGLDEFWLGQNYIKIELQLMKILPMMQYSSFNGQRVNCYISVDW